jgi:hypothetical protein
MEKKPITIKDVSLTNIEKFHTERGKQGLTPAGYFDRILNAGNPGVNQENTEGLQEKVNELSDSLRGLQEENQSLLTQVNEVNDQVTELTSVNTTLQDKVNELENRAPVEVEKKLTGTQFIFAPSENLAKKMQRAIAADRKSGKLKDQDQKEYLQKFTAKAIEYLLKNEYDHLF